MKVIHVKMSTASKPQEGVRREIRDGVLYIITTVAFFAPTATMTVGVVKEREKGS